MGLLEKDAGRLHAAYDLGGGGIRGEWDNSPCGSGQIGVLGIPPGSRSAVHDDGGAQAVFRRRADQGPTQALAEGSSRSPNPLSSFRIARSHLFA